MKVDGKYTIVRIERTLGVTLVDLVFECPCRSSAWVETFCIVPFTVAAAQWVWRAYGESAREKWEISAIWNAEFAAG